MAKTSSNPLAGLANTRTRTLVILIGVVLAVVLLITLTRNRHPAEDALSKQGSQAVAVPSSIKATPGNTVSEKYRELQLAENERRAQEAVQKKTSAIPTIIGAIGEGSQDKSAADINALENQLRNQNKGKGLNLGAGEGGFAGGDFAGAGGAGGLGVGGEGAFGKSARERAREEQEARMRAERERLEKLRQEKERQAELERLRRLAEQQRKEYLEAVQKTENQMKAYASIAYNEWSKFPEQKWVAGTWYEKEMKKFEPADSAAGGQTSASNTTTRVTEKQGASSRFAREVKANKQRIFIKAGTILFGVLDTSVNSDENGPVLATVVGGKYTGARMLGNFTHQMQQESVIIQFSRMSIPKSARSITVSAVAVDPDTARTALASDVNRHLLFRYGSLFASSFISGYGKAIASQGTTTVSPLTGTTTTTTPPLDNKQIFEEALGELGTQWGQAIKPYFNTTPYTVTVDKGTSVGLLFLNDVDVSEGES